MPPVVSYEWLETEGLPGQVTTEDIKMSARKGVFSSIGRGAVMATAAAVALTAIEPSVALAGSAPSGKGMSAARGTSDATDFSARSRYYRGGGGAAAAAFAGIVGTGLAIAATQNRRAYYDDYYGGGPVYYGGGPVFIGKKGGSAYFWVGYNGEPGFTTRVPILSGQPLPGRLIYPPLFASPVTPSCPHAVR